tara:strand:- start:147 stop:1502 length:1356 start_codon:yes stop_codon:yes gene_type:complete
MKKNRKVVLKGNKDAITKYNLEKIIDKSLEFVGFAIGLGILIFFINSAKDLYSYFEDKDYLLQLLKDENVEFIKTNVCDEIEENGNTLDKNSKCDAKDILRKRIDDNIFGFLLPDEFKQDKSYKITDKLVPIKDKKVSDNLEKTLSSKKKLEKTKISTVKKVTKISGCLEGDCINNFSKKNYSNGHYIGEFKNKKEDGQGTFTWASGNKYIGEWKDGNRTGQGTFIWADGAKYSGDFLDGERTGKGTMNYNDGGKYTGDFLNGERHGQGTLTWSDGDKYDGDFVNNNRDGQGTFIWTNGDKYFGQFIQNKMTGEATWISGKDNSTMVGKFKNTQLVDGFVILPDGFKLRAIRENGKLKFGRVQNSNQNIDLLAKQLKRNNDLQTSRMLLDISKSLMGKKNSTPLNLNNLNIGGGFLSGSNSSGMYKTCRYSSSLGTKTKTVFSSAPCPMAY